MLKTILILIFLLLIFQTYLEANTVALELSVTMPNIISSDLRENKEYTQEQDSKIVISQIEERDGKSVIVETTITK